MIRFRNLPLREVEAWFAQVLGPARNVSERSRRVVASIQLDAGREPTGLDSKEEKRVRSEMEQVTT